VIVGFSLGLSTLALDHQAVSLKLNFYHRPRQWMILSAAISSLAEIPWKAHSAAR
jgi:hypothetical protein